MTEIRQYNKEFEDILITFMVTDPELFVRCRGIVSEKYFEDPVNKKTMNFIIEHSSKYSIMPTVEQIKAISGKRVDKISDIGEQHKTWFLEEMEVFCRHKALELAILDSPKLLLAGKYGEVEANIKEAVQIGLVKDLGTDYYYDPVSRLEAIRNNKAMNSTGWADMDHKLYGGFNRGEISIFVGQPGTGKSLFLQNLALNWAELGHNVVYITLELSEHLTSMRLDAMVSGYETKEILKNHEDVALRVKSSQKDGMLRLKQLKNGCTANDIRAFIKEYEIECGRKVDACLVDYLDLCMPYSVSVNPSDAFVKDKYVSEELRNLGIELDILMASASQLNRSSFDNVEFDPSHIAGGISKVNTADNVMAIYVTPAMKEQGRYQIQFVKTRSSSGVGSSINLAFDAKTLRISDMPEDADTSDPTTVAGAAAVTNTLNTIKSKMSANNKTQDNSEPDSDSESDSDDMLAKAEALRKKFT
jgi:hypothetical protein